MPASSFHQTGLLVLSSSGVRSKVLLWPVQSDCSTYGIVLAFWKSKIALNNRLLVRFSPESLLAPGADGLPVINAINFFDVLDSSSIHSGWLKETLHFSIEMTGLSLPYPAGTGEISFSIIHILASHLFPFQLEFQFRKQTFLGIYYSRGEARQPFLKSGRTPRYCLGKKNEIIFVEPSQASRTE